jgi:hypothetical protein
MDVRTGDEIVVKGHHVGDRDRIGVVRGVRGAGGGPPYVIEWSDRPGEHLYWPGNDAEVHEHPA